MLQVISGERRDLAAALARIGLSVAEPVYWAAVAIRNYAYDNHWLAVHRVGVPVISVGNITAGGTGKSPFVMWLARYLSQKNIRVCVLSRGYKSTIAGSNDESLELANRLPTVPQILNRDRVAGARKALVESRAQVLLLDDGFQHRRLGRDLDIVLIDALQPFGFGHLLPRGLLREPKTSLGRADFVVINRADKIAPDQLKNLQAEIRRYYSHESIGLTRMTPSHLLQSDGTTLPLDGLGMIPVASFCGVGNPSAFSQTVRERFSRVVHHQSFPDHHRYAPMDLERLATFARQSGAQALICTHKDLVKFPRTEIQDIPIYALVVDLEFLSGQHELESHLQKAQAREQIAATFLKFTCLRVGLVVSAIQTESSAVQ
jgi:tetraacyldisaccharide 4'-kinase